MASLQIYWEQTVDEVTLTIAVPVEKKDAKQNIKIDLKGDVLSIKVPDKTLVEGALYGFVDDVQWYVDEKKVMTVHLAKEPPVPWTSLWDPSKTVRDVLQRTLAGPPSASADPSALKAKADKGNVKAMLQVANTSQDPQEKLRYLSMAADTNDVGAMWEAGVCLHTGSIYGIKITPNLEQAAMYYKKCAPVMPQEANWNLGLLCEQLGDASRAVSFWKVSAEAGYADAHQRLAECYAGGMGVEVNGGKAREHMAAAQKINPKLKSKLPSLAMSQEEIEAQEKTYDVVLATVVLAAAGLMAWSYFRKQ